MHRDFMKANADEVNSMQIIVQPIGLYREKTCCNVCILLVVITPTVAYFRLSTWCP